MLKKLIIILALTFIAGLIEGFILFFKKSPIFFKETGEVKSIGLQEFKEILKENPFIIDARGKGKYTNGHLPGAVPYSEDLQIPEEKKVVIYNDEDSYDLSLELADSLKKKGYKVYIFFDGWRIWNNENN